MAYVEMRSGFSADFNLAVTFTFRAKAAAFAESARDSGAGLTVDKVFCANLSASVACRAVSVAW